MSSFADALIDELGGTRETARMTDAPESSVSGWRSGLTGSRLNHLLRTARMERPQIDLANLARKHGVALPVSVCGEGGEANHASDNARAGSDPSPGTAGDLSAPCAGASA